MSNSLKTGDVVLVDLGLKAKVRPCLVLSPKPDSQRDLAVVAPMTTERRGGECEIAFPKPLWLRENCVVNLAGLLGVEFPRIEGKLGCLPSDKVEEARLVLARMFGFENPAR
jgi:mRNA interferase MazF